MSNQENFLYMQQQSEGLYQSRMKSGSQIYSKQEYALMPDKNIFSPVFGLRPSRAGRTWRGYARVQYAAQGMDRIQTSRTFLWKVPKPMSDTLSPFDTDSTMTSSAAPDVVLLQ